jgi:polygalacturonase
MDHGAVGDGEADDTAAVHAAIEEAHRTGKSVFFPPGTYNMTIRKEDG